MEKQEEKNMPEVGDPKFSEKLWKTFSEEEKKQTKSLWNQMFGSTDWAWKEEDEE